MAEGKKSGMSRAHGRQNTKTNKRRTSGYAERRIAHTASNRLKNLHKHADHYVMSPEVGTAMKKYATLAKG